MSSARPPSIRAYVCRSCVCRPCVCRSYVGLAYVYMYVGRACMSVVHVCMYVGRAYMYICMSVVHVCRSFIFIYLCRPMYVAPCIFILKYAFRSLHYGPQMSQMEKIRHCFKEMYMYYD